MITLINWLFGCSHSKLTFPITIRKRTYQCCLKCGKELECSWPPGDTHRDPPAELRPEVVR